MLHHVLLEGRHSRSLWRGGHRGVHMLAGEEGVDGERVVECPRSCGSGWRVGSRSRNEVVIEIV